MPYMLKLQLKIQSIYKAKIHLSMKSPYYCPKIKVILYLRVLKKTSKKRSSPLQIRVEL